MEYNLKRPKRINEEDEDELLRFQEEFLKNKSSQQPAAKVVKRETNVIDESQKGNKLTDKKSKFHIDFQEDKNAYEAVLTDIVEKPLRNDYSKELNAETEFEQIKVEKINLNELKSQLSQDKRKNKSLFAQNLEAKGKLKAYYQLNQVYQPNRVLESDDKIKSIEKHLPTIVTESGSRKQLITGEGVGNVKDAEQIHVENLELLAKMTPEEIIAEQKRLVDQLDPKLVAFIKKRSDKTTTANSQNETVNLEENETPKIEPDKILEELGMKPYKSWLQMEKIEFEKLEWMLNKSMKRKVEVGESSVPARFDFSGNLMRPDEEISTRAGLHHHGNDPDSPGYSLDELFLLARSKFTQQRTLAIQTLANVVSKCHQGAYADQIKSAGETATTTSKDQIDDENNLLYQLIDGGLLLLLRLSLDEQTESIISASLSALKCLLQPTRQEEAFDRQFDLDPFVRVDSLHPFSSFFAELDSKKPTGFKVDSNLNLSEKRELSELKDDEYIKQDLVSGLMRMNLIERFRYLLGMYQPQLTYKLITNNMFSIMFRLMRHSAEFTFEFMKKYSQFIDSLASNFLPLFINGEGDNDLANVANMVKLIRLLASTGPSLAQTLYNKYSLKEKLINYLTCDKYVKTELDLVGQLQIESIRLLKTFIVYSNQNNSNIGVDCFYDCYELLLKKLSVQFSNSNDEISSSLLVTLFHVYLRTTNSNPDVNSSVFSILSTFVTDQFKAAQSTEAIKKVPLLSVCLSYSVDYLEKSTTSDRNSRIDALSKHLIDPFLGSNEGVLALERLVLSRLQSTSVNSESMRENFQKIASNNLSYLPTAMVIPSADDCFFRLVTSYLRFYHMAIIRLKKTNVEDKRFSNVHRLMANDYLRSYFRAFLKNCSQDTNKELLLNRQENLFVYNAVRLMFQVYNLEESEEIIETTKGKKLFLQLALSLIPKFKHGEEHIFHDLIATCLFNMSFWSEYLLGESNSSATNENILINHFSTLKLEERCENSSSSGESELVSAQSIKSFERVHIYECLNQVKLAYLSEGSLMQRRVVEHSRLLVDASSSATLFTSPRYSARPIASVDWMYAPIVNVLEAYESQKKGFKIEVTKSPLSIITNCLKYIYLMETHMSSDYMDIHINPARRFVRLLYVYLLEADIFLDKQVRTMLYLIYFKYAKLSTSSRPFLSHLDLDTRSIDSLLSFEDLYRALLDNYDSTSFGDYVFSLYLVVPLQTAYSMKYRQIFWSDYSHLFKYLKFDTPSTQLLIGLNSFVQPNEKSLHMIRLYAQVLLDPMEFQHTINSKLAYTIIVANLNSFIFEHINQVERKVEFEFKRLLVKQFLAFSNEKLKTDLINCKCVNETTNTIELYEELPLIRKQWINQLNI